VLLISALLLAAKRYLQMLEIKLRAWGTTIKFQILASIKVNRGLKLLESE